MYDPTEQFGKLYVFVGAYNSPDEAKRIRDKAVLKMLRGRQGGRQCKLNYPESDYAEYMREYSDWSARDFIWKLQTQSVNFARGSNSSLKGVHVVIRSKSCNAPDYYRMSVSFTDSSGQHIQHRYGRFHSEEEAARAYDKALLAIKGNDAITNFRPSSYSAAEIEEARQGLAEKYPNYFASTATPYT